jgi:predicted nucleic acid-binding protein
VRRIFVDTSALLAHLDADDPRHPAVRTTFASLQGDELVTHGYVVAESLAVARRRLGLDGVRILLDDILPAIDLLSVAPALHAEAQRRYRAALPTGTSFVDHVSLAVIEREGIGIVFALDPDLAVGRASLIPPA